MGILDSLTGITGDGNHDSILGNFGKKFQKYTDPLAMIGGDKYVNLTSVEIPRLVNTGLSKVMQPFEKIDKTINPVRRYVPGVDKISNVIADKPGSAIGTVVGGIFAAPALGIGGAASGAGAAGGGAAAGGAAGGAGAAGAGAGMAGGTAAGYGGGVASSVLPGIMEGGTVGASYGGASGLGAFGGSVGTGSITGAGSTGGLGLSSAGGMDWSSMLQQQSGSGQSNSSQSSSRQSDSDFKRWQDEQKLAIAQAVADASRSTSAYPTTDYGFGTNLSLLQGDA